MATEPSVKSDADAAGQTPQTSATARWLDRVLVLTAVVLLALQTPRLGGAALGWARDLAHERQVRQSVQEVWGAMIGAPDAQPGVDGPDVDGPVVVEFLDYQCPACRAIHSATRRVQREGIRIVHLQLPLDGLHPAARDAARLAVCAEEQGLFGPTHDLLMTTPFWDGAATLTELAGSVPGLNPAELGRCLESERPAARLARDLEFARRLGIQGTPTFVGRGGVQVGIPSKEELQRLASGTD